MKCSPFVHGESHGFVCGDRRSLPKCSTPGCHKRADLSCDHPVERKPAAPKPGDSRLHKEHKVTFYVKRVDELRRQVTISTAPSGQHGVIQVVSFEDWLGKAVTTCDRPICGGCAVEVGPNLHHCPPHARKAP